MRPRSWKRLPTTAVPCVKCSITMKSATRRTSTRAATFPGQILNRREREVDEESGLHLNVDPVIFDDASARNAECFFSKADVRVDSPPAEEVFDPLPQRQRLRAAGRSARGGMIFGDRRTKAAFQLLQVGGPCGS